jgi:hypothetical protein
VNFGLALANGNIPGVKFDLLALNNNREPESAEAALIAYSKIILPERKTDEQIKRLTPLLNDPELQEKVGKAARSTPVASDRTMEMNNEGATMDGDAMTMTMNEAQEENPPVATKKVAKNDDQGRYRLSQVVGILIGSPEFQRR